MEDEDAVRKRRMEVIRSLQEQVDAFHKEGEENEKEKAKSKRRLLTPPDSKPEDVIPDLPENRAARDFLKSAPARGLHMPLGKEVKVMQCWRCKACHRTGDKDCPLNEAGNIVLDAERQAREDPMAGFLAGKPDSLRDKKLRANLLRMILRVAKEEEEEQQQQGRTGRSRDKKSRSERKERRNSSQERSIEHWKAQGHSRSRSRDRDRGRGREHRKHR